MFFTRLIFAAALSFGWSWRFSSERDTGVALLQKEQSVSKRPGRRSVLLEAGAPFPVEPLELLTAWEPWTSDQKMKVVYGVFTSPLPKYAEQMAAVADTWAKEVPPQKLLVVGVNGTAPGVTYKQAPMCQDGHVNNPGISCKEATLLTTGYSLGADWVVVVGSDNYVFPRNFEERLEKEDHKKPQILAIWGCGEGKFCEDHQAGLCGGGGYAISRGALDKMVGQGEDAAQKFIQESMTCASTVGGYWSDQVTSCIARRRNVDQVNLEGLYGWKICRDGDNFVCNFYEDAYRKKIEATSPKSLTFHYIGPEEMHKIHKIVKETSKGTSAAEGEAKVSLLSTHSEWNTYDLERAAYIQRVDQERNDIGAANAFESFNRTRLQFVEGSESN